MPLPINRVPPGLLSLLDVKNQGVNPVQLADQLSATLDLGAAYAASYARNIQGTTNAIAAVGTFSPVASGNNFRPQPGELWLVEKVAIKPNAAIGVGVTVTFAVCVYDTTLGPILWTSSTRAGSAGQLPNISTDKLIVCPAGQGIGVAVEAIAGGNVTFQFDASVTILKV